MAFSSKSGGSTSPMAEINVTPLVDVMLVLLIIFMITAPMLTHRIRIDLPQPNRNVQPPLNPPEPIKLQIRADGSIFWNSLPVTISELQAQLAVTAVKKPQPELQINASPNVEYQNVAAVLADAKGAGLEKIGFENTDQGGG
jgi:biopolymer transport protein ExbD